MKPLPNLNNDAAMLRRGKLSALMSSRNEAAEELRNAVTRLQGCDWPGIREHADVAREALGRLQVLASLAEEVLSPDAEAA